MILFKCKMCGGDLSVAEGENICECEYCGSRQTIPNLNDEKKITLFTRANRLRSACEFDKAAGVYESIVAQYREEAEAYWGLVLCKYGIEYVDDPGTARKVPTCHRSSFDSVLEDADFEMVMEYADAAARAVYRDEAKAIERLRAGIIEVSSKEAPYDIFICYKETDLNGGRTLDSVIAQDVYDVLTEKGYRVFFSRITLEDRLGEEYEPYIFAALNSAKIMLAFGTDYEHYNAVWVKNEWSRFLDLIAHGAKKTLIPCYKNLDAYDMPREFARLQAQDMGKVGAVQDLLRGIEKILGKKAANAPAPVQAAAPSPGSALTTRGHMFLEDGDVRSAADYFERALDQDPTDARAYLGKFLIRYGGGSLEELRGKVIDLEGCRDFQRAIQFGDAALVAQLEQLRTDSEQLLHRSRLANVVHQLMVQKRQTLLNAAFQGLGKCSEEELAPAAETLREYVACGTLTEEELEYHLELLENMSLIMEYFRARPDLVISSWELRRSMPKEPRYYSSAIVMLKSCGYLVNPGYGLMTPDEAARRSAAKEEERARREAAEAADRARKEAYAAALKAYRAMLDENHARIQEELEREFGAKRAAIGPEGEEKIRRTALERELLRKRMAAAKEELASLGLFQWGRKKTLQAELEAADKALAELPAEKDIRWKMKADLERLDRAQKKEMEKRKAEFDALNPPPQEPNA